MLKRQVRDLPQLACGDLSDGLVFDAVRIRLGAGVAFPGTVREDRPGFPVVSVTRLQSSLNATARVLLSSGQAFDTPVNPSDLPDDPGPAVERSGTHPDGTHTRGSEAACRTQHGGRLVSGDDRLGLRSWLLGRARPQFEPTGSDRIRIHRPLPVHKPSRSCCTCLLPTQNSRRV